MDEQQLFGGVANAGRVTRAGRYVLRPRGPHADCVDALLRSLRAAGFSGAPVPAGVTGDGRERLEFIEGDVPLPPYPDWAQSEETLASVAVLMRRFHDASGAAWSPELAGLAWSPELADPAWGPAARAAGGGVAGGGLAGGGLAGGGLAGGATGRLAGGAVICHNDVCLENIVFRDGVAIALLDFDFAAPGRPAYDLVQFARLCVPIDDEISAARLGWQPADKPARLRLVADSYGLDFGPRRQLLEVMDASIARGGEFVRRRVEAGDPNFIAMWEAMGGGERFDRRRRWWSAQRQRFAAALR
jgi:Phosphotransferase enzyme family